MTSNGGPPRPGSARASVLVGLLGFLLALTGAGSLAVYWLLSVVEA